MQPDDHVPDPESPESSTPGPDPIAADAVDSAGATDGATPAPPGSSEAGGGEGPAPVAEDDMEGTPPVASGTADPAGASAAPDDAGPRTKNAHGLASVPGGADPRSSREGARPHSIRPVEFTQIEGDGPRTKGSLDLLLDVKLPISVELGRADAYIKDILEYGPGTVVELDKMAGDPVDILVNGRLVAQGEVVVVDDHFGVRLTALLSPKDRLRSLA